MTKWQLFPRDLCGCNRRSGCRWFNCGQPGPEEHAYKCEVFYATEGNFLRDPASLASIRHLVAHVLGYTDLPPHPFGRCGKQWTLAALQYRLRDGAMNSSFALILTPRPVPAALVATVQILAETDKPYNPRGHRLFDAYPFSGLGGGRWGTERKHWLSHIAVAVWSLHASWLALERLGRHINWNAWQFDHLVSPPDRLLGIRDSSIDARLKKARSMNSAFVSSTSSPSWVFVPPTLGPGTGTGTDSSRSNYNNSPSTPPPLVHPRPQSFAGFACWDGIPSTPPSTRPPAPQPEDAVPTLSSSVSMPVNLSRVGSKPAISHRHSIMVLEDNGSTYYLTNEGMETSVEIARGSDVDAVSQTYTDES